MKRSVMPCQSLSYCRSNMACVYILFSANNLQSHSGEFKLRLEIRADSWI